MLPSPGIHGHHSNQHHNHHPPSPPSPPLPPPPPPPPIDSSIPRNFLRPIPVKREDKLFSSQEPSSTKRGGNQFLSNINESPSSPPSAQIRRSLSMAKEQESNRDLENVKDVIASKRNREDMVNTLPKVNGQLVRRKPGNLFLSQLYFLFHLSLVICVLRANGELVTSHTHRFKTVI